MPFWREYGSSNLCVACCNRIDNPVFVQMWTGLDVSWIFGWIVSFPAIWLFVHTLWMCTVAVFGKKTAANVIAVKGRAYDMIKVQYQDGEGMIQEAEARAVWGLLKRVRPPEQVVVCHLWKSINFGWRSVLYWLCLDAMVIPLTILCWIGFSNGM